ncbi:MAG: TonB-dependent receptor domain-containing protein [Terriglobia bacterium]
MSKSRSASIVLGLLMTAFLVAPPAPAQQSLGSITGTVTDSSGAVVPGVQVTIANVQTGLRQTAKTSSAGSYSVFDLPIGTYTVTFGKEGFNTLSNSGVILQANRTATLNASLQPGTVTTTVTVTSTPLLNKVDTTNGYTLGAAMIQAIPLGTGSFTQLALLSPGVNADLLSGSGTNAGLGNQNIFANGQRDSSNSFAFNGVNTNNIFNGKTSSAVSDNRFVLNTGERFTLAGGEIQTGTSVYDAIGQGLPTPPPETIQELQVNTSMYSASEGAYSGAHISLQTRSGTNDFHGQAYEYFQNGALNAAPFFYNAAGLNTPALHRNTFGATLGGPIKRDKVFFFGSYQGIRASDQDSSLSYADVPPNLTNDRSAAALAQVANTDFSPSVPLTASDINPVALKIMNATLPNGKYLFPSPTILNQNTAYNLGYDAVVQGSPTLFTADQVNANIDYNISDRDRLAGKYYFQTNPTLAPFAISQVEGFPQQMSAGSQTLSLENTSILSPNVTWTQRAGFVREQAFARTEQQFSNSTFGINVFGLSQLPGITIGTDDFNVGNSLYMGASSNFADAGIFQNQWEGATDLTWVAGRHTFTFGANWDYNQLNVINDNNEVSRLSFDNFATFLTGSLCSPSNYCSGVDPSAFLNGATNRYYRTNQVGAYGQDNIRLKPNFTLNLGLRWDWDGPLSEEHGNLTNFDPSLYKYSAATDTIENIGLVVAGNNSTFGTKGVSASTLTGRQWGFAPRIGVVYAPSSVKNFVVRAGVGLYYDRGEYFTELSPSAGSGISGPFGVTTEQPFVVPFYAPASGTFQAPFGTTVPAPPASLAGVSQLIPNIAQLEANTTPYCTATGQFSCGPLQFAGYDPTNTLPYSENWTLDLQWQPTNNVVLDLAYVGNHGVHEVIPIPFNEAGIATPAKPIHGQTYSYGYNVSGVSAEGVSTLVAGYGTGNADLRAPYIGFDPNSQYNEAEGQSHYNALEFSVTKRTSHGLSVVGSYTWSHALDDGSGTQLFYNGNNPSDPSSAYGNAGFDRTHVFTVSYQYQLPVAAQLRGVAGQLLNGWGVSGITVAESGQPYSVIDFSGGVGSLFYGGGQDEVTNPIVPVGGYGATSTNVKLQGTTGVNPGQPILNSAAFGLPVLAPGTDGVPPCDPVTGACDTFETGFGAGGRNIFRGPFQTRFDFSVFKNFKLNERFTLRYDAEFFNLFNQPSFDTPNNNVEFNPCFANPPENVGAPGAHCYSSSTPNGYTFPPHGQLGIIQHTIGSPRFIQMALHLNW